jgi:hypothetical protein
MRTSYPGLADAALGEGAGIKLNKLSVKEIKAVRVALFLGFPLFLSTRVFVIALRNVTPETSVVVPAAGEQRWRRWWRRLIHRLLSATVREFKSLEVSD